MNFERRFEELWNRQEFSLPDKELIRCAFAEKLAEHLGPLVTAAIQSRSHIVINQTKVVLLDKFFEWRKFVPEKHRLLEGDHLCLFEVFETAYEQLKVTELALAPPMLFLPPSSSPAPASPPPPEIGGIFIGERE
jgi:hypothetical protein